MVRTVGVEEEFLLLRADLGGLAPRGEEVVDLATDRERDANADADADAEVDAGGTPVGQAFEHELKREQAELGTPPCSAMDELGEQLRGLRERLATAAASRGVRLVACGTSPLPGSTTTTADDRYERMGHDFAITARQQLTCGMHVHVAVDSRDEGVAVLDRIRPWLAVLSALSANSPFWQGRDTGYASYRSQLWGQWPTAGPVEPFGDVAGYDRATADLVASGAALDHGMIYFDARLSASYPTVEIRVADVCPSVTEAVLLATLARALVSTAARRSRDGEPAVAVRTDLLRAAQWRAARWGMTGDLVDPTAASIVPAWTMAGRLVDWVRAELVATGDVGLVAHGLDFVGRTGTGAQRQRAALSGSGRIEDVLRALVVAGPSDHARITDS